MARLNGGCPYEHRSRPFVHFGPDRRRGARSRRLGCQQLDDHKVYKWVDEQGVTHYGDRIPPEYAAQAHGVINGQGIEVEHTDAQKTAEQLAAEDQKRLDAEQSANRDRNLLTTYSSVQEIEHLRDQRLSLLTDQIKLKEQFLETLNGKMNKLKVTSSRFKPYSSDPKAPPMPDQLAEDLVRVGSDIHTQEENLRQKRSEQANMNQAIRERHRPLQRAQRASIDAPRPEFCWG